jgi:hypothetical protein
MSDGVDSVERLFHNLTVKETVIGDEKRDTERRTGVNIRELWTNSNM